MVAAPPKPPPPVTQPTPREDASPNDRIHRWVVRLTDDALRWPRAVSPVLRPSPARHGLLCSRQARSLHVPGATPLARGRLEGETALDTHRHRLWPPSATPAR